MLKELNNDSLSLTLLHPEGELSTYVQCIWAATVAENSESGETRQLFSDGCRGISFVLNGIVRVDGESLESAVSLQPMTHTPHEVSLSKGAEIAGIRFQPGIAKALFEEDSFVSGDSTDERLVELANSLLPTLKNTATHNDKIQLLSEWIESLIRSTESLPQALLKAVASVKGNASFLSQRQIERQFKQWIGITPKHYQRILRVRRSLHSLKLNPSKELAEFAIEQGFSDQAHMTREFKRIAKVTPKRYSRRFKAINK